MSYLLNTSDEYTPIQYPSRYITLTLYLWHWPIRAFLRLWARHKIHIEFAAPDLDPAMHYVIASNHANILDTIIVADELSSPMWRRLHSFRFMGFRRLFANPVRRWILISVGAFPTKPIARLPYGVPAATKFLLEGNTVVIFPEGRRTTGPGNGVHHGVERLAKLPNTMIIPMHIEWSRSGRRSYRLTAGRPIDARNMTAEALMEHIYALELPE